MARPRQRRSAEERLERLVNLQTMLAAVSREIGPALELEPVLKSVLAAMRSLVDFRGGTIQLVDDAGCYIAAADPPVTADLAASRVPVGTGLSGRAVADASTIYCPDLDDDPRVDPAQRRTGNNATTHSYLAVPLMVLGQCIGVLQMDSDTIDAFDAEDRAVLEGLATQVAGAIESARRYEHVLELERLKDDFIARISHELRTPLTIVSGFTELLLADVDLLAPEDRQTAIQRVKHSVDRLGGLLEEILYISRLDAGMSDSKPEPVPLAALVEQIRTRSIDPAQVKVEVPADLTVVADPLLLQHLLSLVVDNALKYAGDAAVSAGSAGGDVWVSVRDHGPGIPPEQRELVFERFWRGQHQASGMGLGLATARHLAAAIGGRLELGDAPGGGAVVTIAIHARPRRADG